MSLDLDPSTTAWLVLTTTPVEFHLPYLLCSCLPPPPSIAELIVRVEALVDQHAVLVAEVRRWTEQAAAKAASGFDTRLRPFAIALGRLLAVDVEREPVLLGVDR